MAGAYDELAEELVKRLKAEGVFVLVRRGVDGSGVSASGSYEFQATLPWALRDLALRMCEQAAANMRAAGVPEEMIAKLQEGRDA